tara:strand:- start:186 stop:602 length:417 start_codon:yes stop_codon:yes gene_type:complete
MFSGCQFEKVSKNHGINFLENREKQLKIDTMNQNDVVNILGKPHAKSISTENIWFYFERTYTRGELVKLGQNILKKNNVLKLEFNNYGILKGKEMTSKNEMNEVKYYKAETKNTVKEPSFVNKFIQSVRQKMYSKRKF